MMKRMQAGAISNVGRGKSPDALIPPRGAADTSRSPMRDTFKTSFDPNQSLGGTRGKSPADERRKLYKEAAAKVTAQE